MSPRSSQYVGQRLAIDVLHGEVRLPVIRDPAVEQAGHVDVLETGQDLPLAEEAPQDGVAVHAALDELDDRALLEPALDALGQIDDAHAAAAQLAEEPVGPHPTPGWLDVGDRLEKSRPALDVESVTEVAGLLRSHGRRRRIVQGEHVPSVGQCRPREKAGRVFVRPHQTLDFLAQPGIPGAGVDEEWMARVSLACDGLLEDVVDTPPASRIHLAPTTAAHAAQPPSAS